MNTAVIIDDERLAIEELKYLMSHNNRLHVVETFTNPIHAYEYLRANPVDIVFLDIQMPMKSGLDLAKDLMRIDYVPKIVFVTAYDSYAIEAFDVNAVDYILKPTSQERLDQAVQKVISTHREDQSTAIHSMIEQVSRKQEFITLYTDGIFVPVRYENIIYCRSDDGVVTIHTKDRVIPFGDTLSRLEETLVSPCFFRCHRSYLVNIQHIEKIEPTERTYLLKMVDEEELIPVSRSNVHLFKKIMSIQ